MARKRGSMTLEAVISMTVFIGMMLMLMHMVKLVMFMTILNNAATETAKTIAVLGYPISMLNEAQSGLEDKEKALSAESLGSSLKSTVGSTAVSSMLGGNPKELLKSGASSFVKNLVEGAAVNLFKGHVYEKKAELVHYLGGELVNQYISDTGISFDPDKLVLRTIKIPVTEAEFKTVYSDALKLSDNNSLSANPSSSADGLDGNFNAEDVLVCLEYPYQIAVPMLPAVEVTLRSTAVEHGWLNSTCSGAKRTEGINVKNWIFGSAKTVYVPTGGHGKRYHKKDCKLLWTSNQATTVAAATQNGFTPCKVCKPDDND